MTKEKYVLVIREEYYGGASEYQIEDDDLHRLIKKEEEQVVKLYRGYKTMERKIIRFLPGIDMLIYITFTD